MIKNTFFKKKTIISPLSILLIVLISSFLPEAGVAKGGAKIDERFLQQDNHKSRPIYAEGEVLVKFRKGIGVPEVNDLSDSLSAKVQKHFRTLSKIKGQVYVLLKSTVRTTPQLLVELKKHPDVDFVSPNHRVYAAVIPHDRGFQYQWGFHNTGQEGGSVDVDIDAPEAWDKHTGSAQAIVAVIDSGIDYTHPDLAANMWVNAGEIAGNGIDDDGNGYVDDVYGINAITGSGDPMDDCDHGTHCAGIIGAPVNNIGVVGVNWNVSLLAAKFLDATGGGDVADAIACIDYVIDQKTTYLQKIAVINASYVGHYFNQIEKDAIDAAGAVGMVFCAAAGNDGTDNGTDNDITPHYPASYTSANIIAVTAVDRSGNQLCNYGATSVDLGAPGDEILSTVRCIHRPRPGDTFFDDMESGAGQWVSGGTGNTWAITTDQEGFENPDYPPPDPPHFWSDSPGSNYSPNTDSWLMNAADIDLSTYVGERVSIGFSAAVYIEYYFDHAYVEVSGNSGTTWTRLMDFSGFGYYWLGRYNYLIPEEVKTAHFRFRFRLVSDESVEYWGWLIDNVGIGTNRFCSYMGPDEKGTSMAAAHVSGAVAFVATLYPADTVAQRIARILENTVPLPSLHGKCVTGGLLNIDRAVGYLTLTSPNGGETWQIGSTQNITWNAARVFENLNISLWKDGLRVGTIASGINPADGTYTWQVGRYIGGTATPDAGYTIKIKEKNTRVMDTSDAPFTLSSPGSIRLTSPNGGENWQLGTTRNITWEASGISGNLRIILGRGNVRLGIIATGIDAGAGSYSWTVGQYIGGVAPAGSEYRIKIKHETQRYSDLSDNSFTLTD